MEGERHPHGNQLAGGLQHLVRTFFRIALQNRITQLSSVVANSSESNLYTCF